MLGPQGRIELSIPHGLEITVPNELADFSELPAHDTFSFHLGLGVGMML
jgi:hypothetical protein